MATDSIKFGQMSVALLNLIINNLEVFIYLKTALHLTVEAFLQFSKCAPLLWSRPSLCEPFQNF